MLSASSPETSGTAVASPESRTPSTSSRFDAGSVLTRRTRDPPSASATAAAQASDVFPTPPFPVKKRNRVGLSRKRRPHAGAVAASAIAVRSSDRIAARDRGQRREKRPLRTGGGVEARPRGKLLTRGVSASANQKPVDENQGKGAV